MKNSKSSAKSRNAVGKFLRAKRKVLGLTMAQIAFKAGILSLNQIAIYKIETGKKGVRISEIRPLSQAYGVEADDLLMRTGYSPEEHVDYLKNVPPESNLLGVINHNRPVTTEDLKFLITVSEGLSSPLDLGQVVQLLSRRL